MPNELGARSEDHVVTRTDGLGGVVDRDGDAQAAEPSRLAISIDVVAAALANLGDVRGLGRLRTALLVFEQSVVALGVAASGGNVAVVATGDVTQGLVLSKLHRALSEEER